MSKSLWHFSAAVGVLGLPFAALGATGGEGFPAAAVIMARPPAGKLYHGIYPGTVDGEEDAIQLAEVAEYEALTDTRVCWVYFSDNWYHGRSFPGEMASAIRAHGAVPYMRLMLRSNADTYQPEPLFTVQQYHRRAIRRRPDGLGTCRATICHPADSGIWHGMQWGLVRMEWELERR